MAQERRLRRRAAPRSERQAPEAAAPRPVLGGPRHLDLKIPNGVVHGQPRPTRRPPSAETPATECGEHPAGPVTCTRRPPPHPPGTTLTELAVTLRRRG